MTIHKILNSILFAIGMVLTMPLVGCNNKNTGIPDWPWGGDEGKAPTETSTEKPRYIWIDAAANFADYANSKENIERDLTKAKDVGFTDIVVDVRPTTGDVLFKTDVVDYVKKLDYWEHGKYLFYERTADWDYLQAFIDIGHKLGLRVNASINTFVGGNKYPYGLGEQGLLFRDDSKKNWATTLNLEDGLTNAMDVTDDQDPDNLNYGTKFLNPANDEVQQFVLNLLGDLVTYELDGIFLDRCRFNDFNSDFSETTRNKFENFLGKKITNFPNDVIKPGTEATPLPASQPQYMKKWLEFRAKVIHDFIAKAKDKVKSVNKNIKFGVYVGGWYSTYYDVGVNWASPKYDTSINYPEWATPEYKNYGYADLLDFMLIGAYAAADKIYGSGEWTMQGFCQNAKELLKGDVQFAGGPDVGNGTGWTNGGQAEKIPETVDACINAADGYFVFDMVHVKMYDYWDAFKVGFNNYLKTIDTKE